MEIEFIMQILILHVLCLSVVHSSGYARKPEII